ncbi:MAG: replication protein RepA [Spongiibacteraceae bacterium]
MFNPHKIIKELGIDEARRLSKTKWEHRCINAAAAMLEENKATPAYASLMVTSLPHRQPMDGEHPASLWRRQIGHDEYLLESGYYEDGSMIGIPFGAKARLALIYIHTQMIGQGSSVLDVPHTRNAFLKALDMPGGGMSYKHITDQTRRISACRMTISRDGLQTWSGVLTDNFIYDAGLFSPSSQRLESAGLARQTVFSKDFYRLTVKNKIKLNYQAIQIINDNSWAIDLYIWLASELHRLKEPRLRDWETLELGLGVKFSRPRQLRSTLIKALQLVRAVYPQASVELNEHGLTLYPSAAPF